MPEYKLSNHDRRVRIEPSAMAWVRNNYHGTFECAEEMALRHKAQQPLPDGIVVTLLSAECETVSDKGRGGDAQERDPETPAKPADSAPTSEWPKWTSHTYKGEVTEIHCWDSEVARRYFNGPTKHVGLLTGTPYSATPKLAYRKPITPTEAAKWLRANGHEKVADEIDGTLPPHLREGVEP